jgi:PKD repeat protein
MPHIVPKPLQVAISVFFLICSAGGLFGRTLSSAPNDLSLARFAPGHAASDSSITTSTGSTVICPGNSVILIANPAPAGAAFQWKENGSDIPGATASTYVASAAGVYGVIVTSSGVAVTYPTITITVAAAAPVPTFTFSQPTECGNLSIPFKNTTAGNNLSYSWNFGDPASGAKDSSNLRNPVHRFIVPNGGGTVNYTVTLTITNSAGCSNSTSSVVSISQPSSSLGGSNPILYNGITYFRSCTNAADSISFSNLSSTTNTNYVIQWGDGSPSYKSATFSSIVTHKYLPGTWKLNFIVTGQNGCTDTGRYGVFIGSNPAIGFGNPGNTAICTGDSITFPVTGTAKNPAGTIYTITFNDGSPPIVYTSAPPASVTHVFTSSSCGASTPNYSDSFEATIVAENPCNSSSASVSPIYVSQKPHAAITVSAQAVCTGTMVNLTNISPATNTVSNAGCIPGPTVWKITPVTGWTISSGSLGNTQGTNQAGLWQTGTNNVSVVYNTPGSYTVEFLTGNGTCGIDSVVKTICVTPQPVSSFKLDTTMGCGSLAVKATNTSTPPTCGSNAYVWTVSYSNPGCSTDTGSYEYINGTTSVSSNPQILFHNPGLYMLSLLTTSPGGCSATSASQQVTIKSKPIVTLSGIDTICQYNSIMPAVAAANCYSVSSPTYLWTFTGGTPSTSTSANPGAVVYKTSGKFVVSVTVTNECGSTTIGQQVVVNPAPKVKAPVSFTVCGGSSVGPLNFTSPTNGTVFNWTNDNTSIGLGPSGTGDIPAFIATNTGNAAQIANITVTPVNGCTGLPVKFSITVNPEPALPITTTSITYCYNETATALSATAEPGDTLKWYRNASLTGGSKTAPTPVTTTAGSANFYVTQTNSSGCESPPAVITVTVDPQITNDKIGVGQTICSGSAAAALTPIAVIGGGNGVYNYQWQSSTDNGKTWTEISGAVNDSYSPGALTATTKFRRLSGSANCVDTSNTVTINVQGAISNYDIGKSQTICSGSAPAPLTGEHPAGGNGAFAFQWQSSPDGLNWSNIAGATGNDYQPPVLTATTYYQRLALSSSCSAVSSTVAITVNPSPVIDPVSDLFYCIDSTVPAISFTSNPANNTTFSWTNNNAAIGLSASGTGSIPSFTSANTGKTPMTANFVVTPTYTGGGISCSGAPVTFNISILPLITIKANANFTVCAGSQVSAFVPVNDAKPFPNGSVSYVWNVSANMGLSSGSGSQVPAFIALNSGTADIVSTVTVTPVYNYMGQSCAGTPMSYTITVNATPTTANAGNNAKTCNTSYQLNGNTAVVGMGTWTVASGPMANFSDPTGANTMVTGLHKGTEYQFTWTISNHTCVNNASTVKVDVLSDIIDTIQSNVPAVCDGQSAHLSSAALSGGDVPGKLAAAYAYVWQSSTDGVNWLDVSNGTSQNLTAVPTINTYYRRMVSSYGLCPVVSNTIEVIVNPLPPAAIAGGAQTLCSQTQAQLSGNNPGPGFAGTWTDAAPGSILTFAPDAHTYNAIVNGLAPGNTYHLVWTIASPTCGSTSATLSINNLPTLTNQVTPLSATICSGQSVILSGTSPTGGAGGYTYTWESSPDSAAWSLISGQTGINLKVTPAATVFIRRDVTSGNCSLESNVVKVMVQPPVGNNFVTASQQVCTGAPVQNLNGSAPTGGDGVYGYQWQQSTDNVNWMSIPSATNINFQPPLLTQSTWYRRMVTSASCTGPQNNTSQAVKITVYQNAIAQFTAGNLTGCTPFNLQSTIALIPHNDVDGGYNWFANGVFIGTGAVFPAYSILTDGQSVTIKLVATSLYGCSSDSLSMTFYTTKTVTASFTKSQVSGCGPQTVTFTNTSAPIDSGTYLWNFGNGQTSGLVQPAPILFKQAALNHDTTYYITLKAITKCQSTNYRDSVTVTPPLKAVFTPDKTVGCSPLTLTITNQSSGIGDQFIYNFGDGNIQLVTGSQTIQHTYITAKVDTFTLKLTATNACGTDSSFYKIVVYPNSVQANLVVSGNNQSGCAPLTVTFNNNSTGGNVFQYNFDDGSKQTTFQAPETVQHTFNKPGTYNVILTASNKCSTASTTQTILITAPPVAKFAPVRSTYCVNDTASFVNSSTSSVSVSYLWDFGDGASSNQQNPSHVYKIAGNYTVMLTAIRDTAGVACSESVSHPLTIVPLPAVTLTSNYNTAGCTPFSLSVNSKPTDAVSVLWNFGDPSSPDNTSSAFAAQHSFTKAGTYQVMLIAYNAQACSDTSVLSVQVNPSPKAGFSLANTESCVPFPVSITNTSVNAYSYNWYLNNLLVSTAQTPTNIVLTQPNQTYTLKLVVNNVYGCNTDSVVQTLGTAPKPIASFSLKDSISCTGELGINVTNTSANAMDYVWSFGDGSPDVTGRAPTHLYGEAGIFPLRLIAINGLCRDTITRNVQVTNPPKSAFTASATHACAQLTTTFQNLSVNAVSYQWDFGDGSFSTEANPVHTFGYTLSPYTIKLLVYGQFGCADSTIMTGYITVTAPLMADFEAEPDSVLKIPDHTFTFKNLTGGESVTYHWDFGDGDTSAVQSPVHTYLDTGLFAVTLNVSNAGGCTSTRVRTVRITGVPEYLFVPNAFEPASLKSELRTFTVRATGMAEYNLRIFNTWGQLIFQTSALDGSGSPTEGWNGYMKGKPAPQGAYVWEIHARFVDGTEWHGMKYNSNNTPSTTGVIHLIR